MALIPIPPADRPMAAPEPTPTPDVLAVIDGAVAGVLATGAWIWLICGSLLFFIVAGIVAGINFYQQERHRYDLYELVPEEPEELTAPEDTTSRLEDRDDIWPASLS